MIYIALSYVLVSPSFIYGLRGFPQALLEVFMYVSKNRYMRSEYQLMMPRAILLGATVFNVQQVKFLMKNAYAKNATSGNMVSLRN